MFSNTSSFPLPHQQQCLNVDILVADGAALLFGEPWVQAGVVVFVGAV